MMRVSVVVPCYCSGDWLEELCNRTSAALTDIEYEIILVNDASPDNGNTWNEIKRLSQIDSRVKGIELQFNAGQFAALMCGFSSANGEYIVTLDDDLQHPPEEIPLLLTSILNQPEMDCIIGRYKVKSHRVIRKMGSKLVRILYEKISGKPRNLFMGSFRIMRKTVTETMLAHRTLRPIIGPLLLSSTSRLTNVDVEHHPRPYGKSGYRFSKLVSTTLDNIFDATTAPLRAFSIVGALTAMSSLLLGSYYLYNYFTRDTILAGFTSNILLITFFGGMTLLGLGLIGEYIDRIVREVRGAPRWHIKDTTDIK
jgi:glycosyltransferase involved in cell wall biosynthesis